MAGSERVRGREQGGAMNLSVRTRLVGVGGVLFLTGAVLSWAPTGVAAPSAASAPAPSRQAIAKALLERRSRFLPAPALLAMQNAAGVRRSDQLFGEADQGAAARAAAPVGPIDGSRVPRAGLANIRVNNPAADTHQTDQTTQSETSVAVSGKNVAVGFNDSQHSLIFITAATNSNGYGYSRDGGKTFTDGGEVPNRPGYINLGDPWLGSDRGGRMYYSSLAINGQTGNLEIGVARSGTGGRTWSTPTIVSPDDPALFYSGDKDALATGPDPRVRRDNVYVAWDDFVFDPATGSFSTGLPLARSTDGGATWSLRYLDKITSDPNSCSFGQYIGAQPFVDRADGRLYVAAEKITVTDPTCTGGTADVSQVIFSSTDGGDSFGAGVTIATITPASAVVLGPGQVVRTAEFPVLATLGGKLYAAWNEGSATGDHIHLAVSADRGQTWTPSVVTTGRGEIQPALSSDRNGLHLAFYQVVNRGAALDVVLADSANGTSWRAKKATSVSFPGVLTAPQFDPVIATGYMGDYIANVSDGKSVYLAWGDNRDTVKNWLWPNGRHDPDVFFAKR